MDRPTLSAEQQLLCRLIGETELMKNCVLHLMASMRDPEGALRSIAEAQRNATVTINELLGSHTEPRMAALASADLLARTWREVVE